MEIPLIQSIISKYIKPKPTGDLILGYDESLLEPCDLTDKDFLSFDSFVGQEKIIDVLKVAVAAAKQSKRPIRHILLYGQPGLGKSLLAYIIKNETHGFYRQFLGTELKTNIQVDSLLQFLKLDIINKFVFIDEIHHIPVKTAEILYEAMQDFSIKDNQLLPFTLVGATTNPGILIRPLRERFHYQLKLEQYNENDIKEIIINSANEVIPEVAEYLSKRCKGVPRIANQYLAQIQDAAIATNELITMEHVEFFMTVNGINDDGLNRDDIKVLQLLSTHGRPLSRNQLCSVLNLDQSDYDNLIEPYLLNKTYIMILPGGRTITTNGMNYLTNKGLLKGIK
jgi:holliday junction DNA helicase RuvB